MGFLITGVHGSKGVGHKTLTDAIIYYICLTNLLTMKSKSSFSFFELILDMLRVNELITLSYHLESYLESHLTHYLDSRRDVLRFNNLKPQL